MRQTILLRLNLLTALALLATASPLPALAAGEQGPDASNGLLEDEFNPLDLFRHVGKLRPRLRLQQDFTIDQPFRGAEMDTYTTDLRASVIAPLSESVGIRLTATFDVSDFDFHGDSNFLETGRAPADPFDALYGNSYRLEARYNLREDWVLVGGGDVGSSWESGSHYRDGLSGGGFVGGGHIFGDTFSIIAGLRAGSRLARNGVQISPLVQFGWRVTETLEIQSEGIGLKVAYRASPPVTVFLLGSWESGSTRLEDRGGDIGKAVLRNRRLPVQLGVSWKITKHWRVRAGAGTVAYQKLTVRADHQGEDSSAASRGPAFSGRLQVEYRF